MGWCSKCRWWTSGEEQPTLSPNVLPFPCSQRKIAFPGARRLSGGAEAHQFFLSWEARHGQKVVRRQSDLRRDRQHPGSAFEGHGTVQSAQVIMDRDTGRSKGFGFVEMGSDAEAQAAIQALNGKEIEARTLTVNEAKPREDRGGGRDRRY